MAGATRQPTDAVTFMRDLETRFASYEFYAALRHVECGHPELPRLGRAARAADEALRLGQVPQLAFAPAMFVEAERLADGKLWLGGVFLGLFGPHGPLPLHLTEHAHDRRHNFRDPTFARFADIFHHRLLCLFYRAWADAQPTVQADRAAEDRFRAYVGSLFGLGQESVQHRDAMPDAAKLHHAGRLSMQVKNPEGLKVVLEDFFNERVRLVEFVGEWMTLSEQDRLYLGSASGAAVLGQTATLGPRVWGVQSRFRVCVGPMPLASFERFLPGTLALDQLTSIVRGYVGYEMEWDLQLILEHSQVPEIRLGRGARLGWTSWLAAAERMRHADDVVLKNAV